MCIPPLFISLIVAVVCETAMTNSNRLLNYVLILVNINLTRPHYPDFMLAFEETATIDNGDMCRVTHVTVIATSR